MSRKSRSNPTLILPQPPDKPDPLLLKRFVKALLETVLICLEELFDLSSLRNTTFRHYQGDPWHQGLAGVISFFFLPQGSSCVILSPCYNFQIFWCSCLPCDAFHFFCEVCGLPCEVLHPARLSVVSLISCPPWESHSRWLAIGLLSLYSPLWHPRPIMLSAGRLFFVYTPLAFRDCGDLSL